MANNNITISGAKIIFRNFAGKESRFNPAGRRSFAVVLTPDMYEELKEKGFNVRERASRDPDGEPLLYMTVFARFDQYPPDVYRIGHYVDGNGNPAIHNTKLDENSIACLDYEDVTDVDMVISPYNWEVNGKTGVKCYLKTMYANIEEDPFAGKYGMSSSASSMQNDDELPF